MELVGNIIGFFSNPTGYIAALSTGVILFQAWKLLNSIFKPITYIEKLYDLADHITEEADNNFIDKIRNSRIKGDVQRELKDVLIKRKEKIDDLIKRVSD